MVKIDHASGRMNPKIVYIDMDDVLCDFSGAHIKALNENPSIKYPQCQYGFFSSLSPISGALQAVKKLELSQYYRPYILTAPSIKNPLCYTEKRVWVEQHLGLQMVNKLIISPDKSLFRGDYLIDDNIEGKGQDAFTGEIIHFGTAKWPNWNSILDYFNEKHTKYNE